jgi:hypothetical protein
LTRRSINLTDPVEEMIQLTRGALIGLTGENISFNEMINLLLMNEIALTTVAMTGYEVTIKDLIKDPRRLERYQHLDDIMRTQEFKERARDIIPLSAWGDSK